MQSRSKQAVMLKVKTRVADPVYLVQSGSVLNILIQIPPKNKLFFRYPGGKQKKKLPRRQNDRPHHPLVCAQICLMTMVTLMKYSLNSRPNFGKKGLDKPR